MPERTTHGLPGGVPDRRPSPSAISTIRESEVVKRKRSPLDYPLLPEQSTYPRVTYEARIRNRNGEAKA